MNWEPREKAGLVRSDLTDMLRALLDTAVNSLGVRGKVRVEVGRPVRRLLQSLK